MRNQQHTVGRHETSVLRRCGSCDVTWRGTAETTCWFCGFPGVAATETRIVDAEPAARWFVGGELNTCYNCLDRHVEAGRG
ncbi:MAG: propionyl-CoA synthetase, partial [Actinomycetia bacterium]|nr:propionyl-CoA synthetase [Actinomycetes bacterium]